MFGGVCCLTCAPPAAVNGGWSEWSQPCSKSCGGGIHTRSCTHPDPQHGGKPCKGNTSRGCNLVPCPIDGQFAGVEQKACIGGWVAFISAFVCVAFAGHWSSWSSCSMSCGSGTHTRNCTAPKNGGMTCRGPRSGSCNDGMCPAMYITVTSVAGATTVTIFIVIAFCVWRLCKMQKQKHQQTDNNQLQKQLLSHPPAGNSVADTPTAPQPANNSM